MEALLCEPMDTPPEAHSTSADPHSRWLIAIFATLLLQLVLAGFTFLHADAPDWEYTITSHDDALFETEVNDMGAKGWEIASARRATCGTYDLPCYEIVWKRPT